MVETDIPHSAHSASEPCDSGNKSYIDGKCLIYYKKCVYVYMKAGRAMVFSKVDIENATQNFLPSNVIGKCLSFVCHS